MSWESAKEKLVPLRSNLMDSIGEGRYVRVAAVGIVIYLMIILCLGMYWSMMPNKFDVVNDVSIPAKSDTSRVIGSTTTATLIRVTSMLMDKPGGFMSNDVMPPGVWLDNITNWEYGVLIQTRDLARAMRESFSRSQSQSLEDIDLGQAEPKLNYSRLRWQFSSSESQYRNAIKHLKQYLNRLGDPNNSRSQFYSRADNLSYWLAVVETRLGSLSQRLSASVGKRQLNTDLAGDAAAQQSTLAPTELNVKTAWTKIDDVFYESRGAAWALYHFLRAVEVDFEQVLKKKNALVSLQQIIRELESTQQTVFSPMILNGDGFGMLANHSLVMASYISRAHAAIIDLRSLLSQG